MIKDWIKTLPGFRQINAGPALNTVTDETAGGLYVGYAEFGVGVDDPKWKILFYPASGTEVGPALRADGDDEFDNVWSDHASLTYQV